MAGALCVGAAVLLAPDGGWDAPTAVPALPTSARPTPPAASTSCDPLSEPAGEDDAAPIGTARPSPIGGTTQPPHLEEPIPRDPLPELKDVAGMGRPSADPSTAPPQEAPDGAPSMSPAPGEDVEPGDEAPPDWEEVFEEWYGVLSYLTGLVWVPLRNWWRKGPAVRVGKSGNPFTRLHAGYLAMMDEWGAATFGDEGWRWLGPLGQRLLAYLLPFLMFVCSDTCCQTTSCTVTKLMEAWTGKRPPTGTPPDAKELHALEWKGDGATPTNEYFKQQIKGSTSALTMMPNHVVVRIGDAIARLEPSSAAPMPAARANGQAYPYGAVVSCSQEETRKLLEGATHKCVHLCRGPTPCRAKGKYAAHSRTYAGIEAEALVNVAEAVPWGSPIDNCCPPARLLARVCRAAQEGSLLTLLRGSCPTCPCCCCCCARRRGRNPRDEYESESETEEGARCHAHKVGWIGANGVLVSLDPTAQCRSTSGLTLVTLLADDAPHSDTRGCGRDRNGAPQLPLCSGCGPRYERLRGDLRCAKEGCQAAGVAQADGSRLCGNHAPGAGGSQGSSPHPAPPLKGTLPASSTDTPRPPVGADVVISCGLDFVGLLFLVLVRRPGPGDWDHRDAYVLFKGVGVPAPPEAAQGPRGRNPRYFRERGCVRLESLDFTLAIPAHAVKDEQHALTLAQAGVSAAAYPVAPNVHAQAKEGRTLSGVELTTEQIAAITNTEEIRAWMDHHAQRLDPRPGEPGARPPPAPREPLRAEEGILEEFFREVENGEPWDRALDTVSQIFNETPDALDHILKQAIPVYLATARGAAPCPATETRTGIAHRLLRHLNAKAHRRGITPGGGSSRQQDGEPPTRASTLPLVGAPRPGQGAGGVLPYGIPPSQDRLRHGRGTIPRVDRPTPFTGGFRTLQGQPPPNPASLRDIAGGSRPWDAPGSAAVVRDPFSAGNPYREGRGGAGSEPHRLDRMLLNALTTRARLDEDETKTAEGTLGYLRRNEPRYVMLLARGANTFDVALGQGYTGTELYDALRHAGDSAQALATRMGFPVEMKNRIALAFAALALGGRDTNHMPDYCLGVADFPKTTQEQFDAWIPPTDRNLREKRPKGPITMAVWADQAARHTRAFCLIVGQQHSDERVAAQKDVENLHEGDPHKWPPEEIFSVWEELQWDWVEGMKGLLRRLLLEMGDQNPAASDLAAFALSDGPDGRPRLVFPTTFQLEDPEGYFQTIVLVRKERQVQSHLWKSARLAHLAASKGARAGKEEGPPPMLTIQKLGRAPMGRHLSGREQRAAFQGLPTDTATGKKFCPLFSCHGGCPLDAASCPGAHKSITNVPQLKWETKCLLIKCGGHRSHKVVPVDQVDTMVKALRDNANKEGAANRAGDGTPATGAPPRRTPRREQGQPRAPQEQQSGTPPTVASGYADGSPLERLRWSPDALAMKEVGQQFYSLDLGEALPLGQDVGPHIRAALGMTDMVERKQCLVLSLAAAILWRELGRPPNPLEAARRARELRWSLLGEAQAAQEQLLLGGPWSDDVAEVLGFAAATLTAHVGKDFRTLAALRPPALQGVTIHVLHETPEGLVDTVLPRGLGPTSCPDVYIYVDHGHAIALCPKQGDIRLTAGTKKALLTSGTYIVQGADPEYHTGPHWRDLAPRLLQVPYALSAATSPADWPPPLEVADAAFPHGIALAVCTEATRGGAQDPLQVPQMWPSTPLPTAFACLSVGLAHPPTLLSPMGGGAGGSSNEPGGMCAGGHPYASEAVVNHLREVEERMRGEDRRRKGYHCAGRSRSRKDEPRGARGKPHRREDRVERPSTRAPPMDATEMVTLAAHSATVFARLLGIGDHGAEWVRYCSRAGAQHREAVDNIVMRDGFLRERFPSLEWEEPDMGVTPAGRGARKERSPRRESGGSRSARGRSDTPLHTRRGPGGRIDVHRGPREEGSPSDERSRGRRAPARSRCSWCPSRARERRHEEPREEESGGSPSPPSSPSEEARRVREAPSPAPTAEARKEREGPSRARPKAQSADHSRKGGRRGEPSRAAGSERGRDEPGPQAAARVRGHGEPGKRNPRTPPRGTSDTSLRERARRLAPEEHALEKSKCVEAVKDFQRAGGAHIWKQHVRSHKLDGCDPKRNELHHLWSFLGQWDEGGRPAICRDWEQFNTCRDLECTRMHPSPAAAPGKGGTKDGRKTREGDAPPERSRSPPQQGAKWRPRRGPAAEPAEVHEGAKAKAEPKKPQDRGKSREDWEFRWDRPCSNCEDVVFGRRDACRRCGTKVPHKEPILVSELAKRPLSEMSEHQLRTVAAYLGCEDSEGKKLTKGSLSEAICNARGRKKDRSGTRSVAMVWWNPCCRRASPPDQDWLIVGDTASAAEEEAEPTEVAGAVPDRAIAALWEAADADPPRAPRRPEPREGPPWTVPRVKEGRPTMDPPCWHAQTGDPALRSGCNRSARWLTCPKCDPNGLFVVLTHRSYGLGLWRHLAGALLFKSEGRALRGCPLRELEGERAGGPTDLSRQMRTVWRSWRPPRILQDPSDPRRAIKIHRTTAIPAPPRTRMGRLAPVQVLVVLPTDGGPWESTGTGAIVIDTGNGGQEIHGKAYRVEMERLLLQYGLRPTWRPVDLTFNGLGGGARHAHREYTFPLGIGGRDLLLVSAELDEEEGVPPAGAAWGELQTRILGTAPTGREPDPPARPPEVPLILGVPTQLALGVTIRWTDLTIDLEALGVRREAFSLSDARHPEVSALNFGNPRGFSGEFQVTGTPPLDEEALPVNREAESPPPWRADDQATVEELRRMVGLLRRMDALDVEGSQEGGTPREEGPNPEVLMIGGGGGGSAQPLRHRRIAQGYDNLDLAGRVWDFQKKSWTHSQVLRNFLNMADPTLNKGDPREHKVSTLRNFLRNADILEQYIASLRMGAPPDARGRVEHFLQQWPADDNAADFLRKIPWGMAEAVMARVNRDQPTPNRQGNYADKITGQIKREADHLGRSQITDSDLSYHDEEHVDDPPGPRAPPGPQAGPRPGGGAPLQKAVLSIMGKTEREQYLGTILSERDAVKNCSGPLKGGPLVAALLENQGWETIYAALQDFALLATLAEATNRVFVRLREEEDLEPAGGRPHRPEPASAPGTGGRGSAAPLGPPPRDGAPPPPDPQRGGTREPGPSRPPPSGSGAQWDASLLTDTRGLNRGGRPSVEPRGNERRRPAGPPGGGGLAPYARGTWREPDTQRPADRDGPAGDAGRGGAPPWDPWDTWADAASHAPPGRECGGTDLAPARGEEQEQGGKGPEWETRGPWWLKVWASVYCNTPPGKGIRRAIGAAREAARQISKELETTVVSPDAVFQKLTGPHSPARPEEVSELQAGEVRRFMGDALECESWVPVQLKLIEEAFRKVEECGEPAASVSRSDPPPAPPMTSPEGGTPPLGAQALNRAQDPGFDPTADLRGGPPRPRKQLRAGMVVTRCGPRPPKGTLSLPQALVARAECQGPEKKAWWENGSRLIQSEDVDHLAAGERAFRETTGQALHPNPKGESHEPALWKGCPGPEDFEEAPRREAHAWSFPLEKRLNESTGAVTHWYHYHLLKGTLQPLVSLMDNPMNLVDMRWIALEEVYGVEWNTPEDREAVLEALQRAGDLETHLDVTFSALVEDEGASPAGDGSPPVQPGVVPDQAPTEDTHSDRAAAGTAGGEEDRPLAVAKERLAAYMDHVDGRRDAGIGRDAEEGEIAREFALGRRDRSASGLHRGQESSAYHSFYLLLMRGQPRQDLPELHQACKREAKDRHTFITEDLQAHAAGKAVVEITGVQDQPSSQAEAARQIEEYHQLGKGSGMTFSTDLEFSTRAMVEILQTLWRYPELLEDGTRPPDTEIQGSADGATSEGEEPTPSEGARTADEEDEPPLKAEDECWYYSTKGWRPARVIALGADGSLKLDIHSRPDTARVARRTTQYPPPWEPRTCRTGSEAGDTPQPVGVGTATTEQPITLDWAKGKAQQMLEREGTAPKPAAPAEGTQGTEEPKRNPPALDSPYPQAAAGEASATAGPEGARTQDIGGQRVVQGLWFYVKGSVDVDAEEAYNNLREYPPVRALLDANQGDLQWAQFPEDMTKALVTAEREQGDWVKLEHKEWAYLSADRNLLVFTLRNRKCVARVRKAQ